MGVKPAFIRADREVKITGVFESAGLDGAKMTTCNARGVEVAVRNATEGEAWVDDVQGALRDMLSEDASDGRTLRWRLQSRLLQLRSTRPQSHGLHRTKTGRRKRWRRRRP